jgi:toxin ParE1/3/4
MNYQIVLTEEAENDTADATLWYESQRSGLGEEFLLCIEAAKNTILRSPKAFHFRHKKLKGILVNRFPYLMLYKIEEQTIFVIAVFHTSRNPRDWKKRI